MRSRVSSATAWNRASSAGSGSVVLLMGEYINNHRYVKGTGFGERATPAGAARRPALSSGRERRLTIDGPSATRSN
jgi:hypothetical protein